MMSGQAGKLSPQLGLDSVKIGKVLSDINHDPHVQHSAVLCHGGPLPSLSTANLNGNSKSLWIFWRMVSYQTLG